MTKAYLKFPSKRVSFLPKINSRRMGVTPFATAAFRSDGDDDDDDEAEKKQLLTEIKKQFEKQLKEKGYATPEQVEETVKAQMKAFEGLPVDALKALTDPDKGVMAVLKRQAEQIEALIEKGGNNDRGQSVRDQVKSWMDSNKAQLDAIKAGAQPTNLAPLVIKAPVTMTMGVTAIQPIPYYIDNGAVINDLVRNRPTFWDRLQKGRTSLSLFPWVNKVNKQGNAAFIGEGVLKPLASFELAAESSVPKKAAEAMKASMELLYDVEGMTTMIQEELRYEVMMAANTAVLTGTLSSTSPAGITTIASAYTLTTIKTANPNNYDAIRAAQAQLISLNFDRNIQAYINPIDAANMDLAKASDSGVYLLPPFTTADGRRIGATPVFEDNNIAVGKLLIGDMSKYRILMYQDFFISWGWENDDFRKNLMTVLGEMRFHQFVSANHAGAFIYEDLADIKTALTVA